MATTAAKLATSGTRATDDWLGSPRAVVRASALQHNIATMARYCRDHGVDLYPHGKTTMAPQVVAAQLDAGAAGVTVATVAQLRVFQAHGLGLWALSPTRSSTRPEPPGWVAHWRTTSTSPPAATSTVSRGRSGSTGSWGLPAVRARSGAWVS